MTYHQKPFRILLVCVAGLLALITPPRLLGQAAKPASVGSQAKPVQRLLYVASPGIRDYLQYGGHGVLVFDIDNGHKFVRRIPLDGYGIDEQGKPINVKGICGSAVTKRLYVSTKRQLICLDLLTDKVLWQREFPLGCDRMSISPDGSTIYQPSYEKDRWYVLNADDGSIITEVVPDSRAHNTVYAVDGSEAYLAGLSSPLLTVTDAKTHKVSRTVGPFSGSIRPFTVNGDSSLVFVNVNGLLGFEIGDLSSGKKLHRVEVTGVPRGKPLRHGCPSHGIGMTPDERQIWVADGFNSTVHIFDATVMPPKLTNSIKLRGQPGWVTFSIDGTIAWPSTGQAIDVATHKIIGELTDEKGRAVESEKLLEVDWQDGAVVAVGDQFGRGQTHVVAWGKPAGGLQAGIRCRIDQQRVHGDAATTLDLVLRNVTAEVISMEFLEAQRYIGERIETKVTGHPVYSGDGLPDTIDIRPGEVRVVGDMAVGHVLKKRPGAAYAYRVELPPGKYQVGCERVLVDGRGEQRRPRLGTGYLDIEIVPSVELSR